jgi:hypothetical protein
MLVPHNQSDLVQAQANCRVGLAALNTLAGYIDWVSMSHITAENCKLLEILCLLLNEQELQLGAAECLLIAVSRKVSDHFKLTCHQGPWVRVSVGGVKLHVVAERHLKVWDFIS